MLKKLTLYSPNGLSAHSNDECVEYYSQGKSAMAMNWSSRAHLFELNEASPAYKKTGYLPRPAGNSSFQVSPIGGFSLGIPSNISPEFIKYYIEHGSLSSPVFSVVNDPEVRALSPIFNEIDKMEKEEKIIEWARYPLPTYSNIIEDVGHKIYEYIFLNKDLETTLKSCQQSAQKYLN